MPLLHVALTKLGAVVRLGHVCVLLQCSEIVHVKFVPLTALLLDTTFARFLALRLRLFEFGLVDAQPLLLRHDQRQIDREAVCVIQPPDVLSIELLQTLLLGLLCVLLKELLSAIQRPRERLLLFVQDCFDIIDLLCDLREEVAL